MDLKIKQLLLQVPYMWTIHIQAALFYVVQTVSSEKWSHRIVHYLANENTKDMQENLVQETSKVKQKRSEFKLSFHSYFCIS